MRMFRLAWIEWLWGRGVAITVARRVARPARRVELLERRARPERVVRLPPGQPPLGVGGDAGPLVAADAERLQPVAGRAVRGVAARVGRRAATRSRTGGCRAAHDPAVAVDALVAAVAGEAVALVAPDLRCGRVRKVGPCASRPVQRARRHRAGRVPPGRHRGRRAELDLAGARRPRRGGRRVQRAVACLPSWQPRQLAIIGRSARVTIACRRRRSRGRARRRCRARRAAGG